MAAKIDPNWQLCLYIFPHFRFLRELKRLNYVTPTSYLALITTFKSLLKRKREEILNLKTRYEMGLGKLEFASSQVSSLGEHFWAREKLDTPCTSLQYFLLLLSYILEVANVKQEANNEGTCVLREGNTLFQRWLTQLIFVAHLLLLLNSFFLATPLQELSTLKIQFQGIYSCLSFERDFFMGVFFERWGP